MTDDAAKAIRFAELQSHPALVSPYLEHDHQIRADGTVLRPDLDHDRQILCIEVSNSAY